MLFLSVRVDKDIIDEYHYKLIQVRLKFLIHIIHKNNKCIHYSERHHKEFVMNISGSKYSLQCVITFNRI